VEHEKQEAIDNLCPRKTEETRQKFRKRSVIRFVRFLVRRRKTVNVLFFWVPHSIRRKRETTKIRKTPQKKTFRYVFFFWGPGLLCCAFGYKKNLHSVCALEEEEKRENNNRKQYCFVFVIDELLPLPFLFFHVIENPSIGDDVLLEPLSGHDFFVDIEQKVLLV